MSTYCVNYREYMIDDWVTYLPRTPKPYQVAGFSRVGQNIYIKDPVTEKVISVDSRFIAPIRITTNCLLTIGFELNNYYSRKFRLTFEHVNYMVVALQDFENISGTDFMVNKIVNEELVARITLYYIHELQHFFKLYGINRKINLYI